MKIILCRKSLDANYLAQYSDLTIMYPGVRRGVLTTRIHNCPSDFYICFEPATMIINGLV